MLFDSTIRKELARNFGATLIVLVSVVMTMMLIRTLGQASKGVVSASDVLLVMGLTVLSYLSSILTLSLFVASVATLSRMYRDSEMAIWSSCGQGLMQQLRPLLRFAWPILLAVAALSLLVWPWSNERILYVIEQFEQRSDIDRIAPGEFQESADGTRVFFIDKASTSGDASMDSAHNIFIFERRSDQENITSASSAHLENDEQGRRFVMLKGGQRIENNTDNIKITSFDEYRLLLKTSQEVDNSLGVRAQSVNQLLATWDKVEQAEFGWRLSQPFLGFNLVLLSLAFTKHNIRSSSNSLSLSLALLTFIVYYNIISVGQSWVATGKIPLMSFLIGVHGSIFALGVLILLLRENQWLWRLSLKQK